VDNDRAAKEYAGQMSTAARLYLNGRGITDDVIAQFSLGQVVEPELGHEDYRGRISVPYVTTVGGVIGFKFRRIGDGGEPKYLTDHMPTRLYNPVALERADLTGYVAIVEGESDAWTLDGCCGIPTVGIPGSDTWGKHPEWPLIFEGFETVLVFSDNDGEAQKFAGQKLKARILGDLKNARHVPLPDEVNDVNQAYLRYGMEQIRAAAGV
jgi:DNA primase